MINHRLKDYRPIVGDKVIDNILEKASPFSEKHIAHVSSTLYGGGVSEMLGNLIPLMDDAGVHTGWRVIRGDVDFFLITKKFHHTLQGGKDVEISDEEKELFVNTNEYNSRFTHLDHDVVIIHDPQPLPFIKFFKKEQPWIWRCHIDISNPVESVWKYLKQFVDLYDLSIFSSDEYVRTDVNNPQVVIPPFIDPLAVKNVNMPMTDIQRVLKKYDVDMDKPIISQISRFDRWKDPHGVIDCYKMVKKEVDCQLVLLGSFAPDDPEGDAIFRDIVKFEEQDPDIRVIGQADSHLVNALQRASEVVLQKSTREGFGLTVSEALYKGTPVIAGNVGGIKLQIRDGWNGYLVDPYDIKNCADKVTKLLKDEKLRKEMGRNGKEFVKEKFLITRSIMDWMGILDRVFKDGS